jgi:hypothetical protein
MIPFIAFEVNLGRWDSLKKQRQVQDTEFSIGNFVLSFDLRIGRSSTASITETFSARLLRLFRA